VFCSFDFPFALRDFILSCQTEKHGRFKKLRQTCRQLLRRTKAADFRYDTVTSAGTPIGFAGTRSLRAHGTGYLRRQLGHR
jgi:hypothetical protein